MDDQPGFKRCAVIGIGLVGASFALAAKTAGLVERVVGVARRQRTLRAALEVGAADEVSTDPAGAVHGCDLVYLAVPVGAMAQIMQAIARNLQNGCIVTDAGSVKAEVCEAAEQFLPRRAFFVGGHPMAGSERRGPENASADLFCGHRYFLCPTELSTPQSLQRLEALVRAIGAEPVVMDAAEHDAVVALTSHLPHAAAAALIDTVVAELGPQRAAKFSGRGLYDTTRIAGGSEELWADILLANARNIAGALEAYADALLEYRNALARRDSRALVELLRRGRQAREGYMENFGAGGSEDR